MAYSANNNILDDHYNEFATGSAGGTANHGVRNVNTIWGVGSGGKGYGQTSTAVSIVNAGTNIAAAAWTTLLNRIDSIAAHQGATWANPTNPTTGDNVALFTTLDSQLTSMYTNSENHVANGSDVTSTIAASGTWTSNTLQYATYTWSSANQARYFFNAGGTIRVSFARTGGSSRNKNTEWSDLATKCGTLEISSYAMTKSGGGGSTNVLNSIGWYEVTTSDVVNFRQYADTSPYTANYIQVYTARSADSTQLFIKVQYQDAAADHTAPPDTNDANADIVDGTVTTTFVQRPPSTTHISNSWGTLSFATATNTQS